MKWKKMERGKKEQEASVRLKNRLSTSEAVKQLGLQAVVVNFPAQKEIFNVEFSPTSLTPPPEA